MNSMSDSQLTNVSNKINPSFLEEKEKEKVGFFSALNLNYNCTDENIKRSLVF